MHFYNFEITHKLQRKVWVSRSYDLYRNNYSIRPLHDLIYSETKSPEVLRKPYKLKWSLYTKFYGRLQFLGRTELYWKYLEVEVLPRSFIIYIKTLEFDILQKTFEILINNKASEVQAVQHRKFSDILYIILDNAQW